MNTFYGESDLKGSLLEYTKEHQLADAYSRGSWLKDEVAKNGSKKGCFYGCMTQSDANTLGKASEQYGLPLWYVHVTESIYEGLPDNEWLEFPYQAIEILPVDLDMNVVRSLFNYRLLEDQLRFCKGNQKIEYFIKKCMNLYLTPFNQITHSSIQSAWSVELAAGLAAGPAGSAGSVELAAGSAWSAAKSAAKSAELAAGSAWSAAKSAAKSAELAARSARSAAWSVELAAGSSYYSFLRDLLFDCIRINKLPVEKENHKHNINIKNEN